MSSFQGYIHTYPLERCPHFRGTYPLEKSSSVESITNTKGTEREERNRKGEGEGGEDDHSQRQGEPVKSSSWDLSNHRGREKVAGRISGGPCNRTTSNTADNKGERK